MIASLGSSVSSALDHFHGPLVYVVVAALVIAESGFVVGFFVPGEISVVVGGVLAHEHHVSLVLMLVVANLAAIVAFLLGYGIGNWLGPWLLRHRPLRGQEGVARTRALIQRFGGAAVFLGRFVAVVRALMPALVGISDVRLRTFVVFDVAGGLVWATLYTMIGYAVGASYQHVLNAMGTWSLVVVALLVVALVANHLRLRRRSRARRPAEVAGVGPEPPGGAGPGTEPPEPSERSGRPADQPSER